MAAKRTVPSHRKLASQARRGAAPPLQPPSVDSREVIDMPAAIEILKTTQPTFYRWLRTGKLKGMKVGRQWRFYRDDIERFLKGESPIVELPGDIKPLLAALSERLKKAGVKPADREGENGVEKAVRYMIALGPALNASDVHVTSHQDPSTSKPVSVVRYRIDGVLHRIAEIDPRLLPAVIEQWKRLSGCDVHDKDRPQDGRMIMSNAFLGTKGDTNLDIRVSFVPTGLGESLTARFLLSVTAAFDLKRIDYAPADRERILRALGLPWGLILITGPTGSGKTTVLYSCINELARPEVKVLTIEDPVEYYLPWATQIAVKEQTGMTIERAMRAALRSDPDVIMVGEIRNSEILGIVHASSLTGHVVLSTLHTDEAVGALRRMVEMGTDAFVVADSTKLVVAQRLIRKLCPHCSVKDTPPAARLDAAAEAARKGGLNWRTLEPDWRKAVGCDKCSMTGYKGRNVIAEVLEMTPEIGRALRNNASLDELRDIAVGCGMTTMAADGIRRAAAGETTLDEVMRVIG
jgi:general secretion pathway protein E